MRTAPSVRTLGPGVKVNLVPRVVSLLRESKERTLETRLGLKSDSDALVRDNTRGRTSDTYITDHNGVCLPAT